MTTLGKFTHIPAIDVSRLRNGTPAEQAKIAQELGDAARHVGFL